MSENKKKKSKKKKQNLDEMRIKVILIAVILLISFLSVVTILNDKKENPTNKPSSKEEVKKTTLDYDLFMNYLSLDNLPKEYFAYFFQEDAVSKENLPNALKIYLAIREVMADDPEKYADDSDTITISQKDVEKKLQFLFGDSVEYEHTSLSGNSCSYSNFQYDAKKEKYIQEPGDCENAADTKILTLIEDQKTSEDQVEILIKVAFVDVTYDSNTNEIQYHYYADKEKTKPVAELSKYDLHEVIDRVDTYRFQFTKENDRFVFASVQKVGE